MVRESFADFLFFAKDCDRKAPRKADENFAKDKICFCERSDNRKALRKLGEGFVFFFAKNCHID